MLDKMRDYSRSYVIYFFFAAIIITFIFSFGPGSSGCRTGQLSASSNEAATVNGKSISQADFARTYSDAFRRYQQFGGGNFNEQVAEQIHLKDTVLEHLIDRELLYQEAQSRGLHVGDDELAERIAHIPSFQVNGKFDLPTYERAVAYGSHNSVAAFENELRRDLLAEKMKDSVAATAKISDEELKADYLKDHDKANLEFVRLSANAFRAKVAAPKAADIDGFLKEHAAQVEEYYKASSFKFHRPKRVRAQHILAKVDENAPASDVDAAHKKIEAAQAELKAGKDFGEVAKARSEDPGSKVKGGDLGVFGPGTMAKPFEDAAMALQAGQVSDIVRSRFGFHLIKVNEVFAPLEKSLKDAEREIASDLLRDAGAKQLAKAEADAVLAKLKKGGKLSALYPADPKPASGATSPFTIDMSGKPKADETGLFGPGQELLPKIGSVDGLAQAAFKLSSAHPLPDRPFEAKDGYVVVVLKERQVPDMAQLEKERDSLRKKALAGRANAVVDDFVKGLRARAVINKNTALLQSKGRQQPVEDEG